MGCGNVSVHGPYEGVYYINKDHVDVYTKYIPDEDVCLIKLLGDLTCSELSGGEWEYDEVASDDARYQVLESFMEHFQKMFPSFERCSSETWTRGRLMLLENGLFMVALEDNEWSLAIELLQKDEPGLSGLQFCHHQAYLNGMLAALLIQLPSVGTYSGPQTSGLVSREAI